MGHDFVIRNCLCLRCGAIVSRSDQPLASCSRCGAQVNPEDVKDIVTYAAETYYYGYQYRNYYEGAFSSSASPVAKPSLAFAGEAFAWVMLVMLSGVIGGASYDLVKKVVNDLRNQAKERCAEDRSYAELSEVTDEELDEMFNFARDYYQGLEGIRKEVRAAIIEEIVADEVSHDPVLANELAKSIFRKKIKPKHRRKAQELYRIAITRAVNRKAPQKKKFLGFWSSHSNSREGQPWNSEKKRGTD